jgi:hypothetical protein
MRKLPIQNQLEFFLENEISEKADTFEERLLYILGWLLRLQSLL